MPGPGSSDYDLFLAILAFDSYNRGARPNMLLTNPFQVGSATVTASVNSGTLNAFAATSYSWGGSTVISYRGTDEIPSDGLTGWTLGAGGITPASQEKQAIDFYLQATGGTVFVPGQGDPGVVLTGHSLGGGLAGFVGSLTGGEAVAFDYMPFSTAAWINWALDEQTRSGWPLASGSAFFSDFLVAAAQIPPANGPDAANISAYHVTGEGLEPVRAAAASGAVPAATALNALLTSVGMAPLPSLNALAALTANTDGQVAPTALDSNGGVRSPVNLHSMTLLIHLLYARNEGLTDWVPIAKELWDEFFEENVGERVSQDLSQKFLGKMTAGYKAGGMVAYSAIDTGAKPFGDAAIAAFFDDAGDLGRAITSIGGGDAPLKELMQEVIRIFYHFAVQAAARETLKDGVKEKGVLELLNGGELLKVDLTDSAWRFGAAGEAIPDIGVREIMKSLEDPSSALGGGNFIDPNGGYSTVSRALSEAFAENGEGGSIGQIIFKIPETAGSVQAPEAAASLSRPITMFVATDAEESITGTENGDFILGGDGDDTIDGGDLNDVLLGGMGDDVLIAGLGRTNYLLGGQETDTALYLERDRPDGLVVSLQPNNVATGLFTSAPARGEVQFVHDGGGSNITPRDVLASIEVVQFSPTLDILDIFLETSPANAVSVEPLRVDMGGNAAGQVTRDEVSYEAFETGINYYEGYTSFRTGTLQLEGLLQDDVSEEVALVDEATARDLVFDATGSVVRGFFSNNLVVKNAETVTLTPFDDAFLGAKSGTLVTLGGGNDKVWFSPGVGIDDLGQSDRVTIFGLMNLYGGIRNENSQNPYAVGLGGLVEYGINVAGEMIIRMPWWNNGEAMYFLDWQNAATNEAEGQGTSQLGPGNITLVAADLRAMRLLDYTPLAGFDYYQGWEFFGLTIKTFVGFDGYGGGDPLVFDLDGDGIEIAPLSSLSPTFDIDADLYAERTAVVRGDDGMLARDIDGDGRIGSAQELFGAGRTSGFSVLATLDGDGDGSVSAADDGLADFDGDGAIEASDGFSQLRLWRDIDGDGFTDANELRGLADYGIESISLATTAPVPGADVVSGSRITAVSTFTRADGTTGQVADVVMRVNNTESTYVGPTIAVTPDAAALPDLSGHGTTVSLREAMSYRPEGAAEVAAALAAFTTPDMEVLADATREILLTQALGSPVRRSDGTIVSGAAGLNTYPDIELVYVEGRGLIDYSWSKVETPLGDGRMQTAWTFASGAKYWYTGAVGEPPPLLGEIRDFISRIPPSRVQDPDNPGQDALVASTSVRASGITVSHAYDGVLTVSVPENSTARTIAFTESVRPPREPGPWDLTVAKISGQEIAVQERLIGESLEAFFLEPDSYQNALVALGELIDGVREAAYINAARIAVQDGGLAGYFDSIRYDGATDKFQPVDVEQQLVGVYRSIMQASTAEADPLSWFAGFKDLLDRILVDYDQGRDVPEVGFTFAAVNLISAFEQVAPPYSLIEAAQAMRIAEEAITNGSAILTGSSDAEAPYWLIGAGALVGTGGSDIAYLDGSDQTIAGGGGPDSYIAGRQIGTDIIDDRERLLIDSKGPDTLTFSRHLPSEIEATRVGTDLVLTVRATRESITIKEQFGGVWPGVLGSDFSDDTGVSEIVFMDGSYWTAFDIAREVSRVDDASTTLTGTEANDQLEGGNGDDSLSAGGDSDIYVIGRGDGRDIIEDNETNILRPGFDVLNFTDGISIEELTFSRVGNSNDVTIGIAGTTDSVTLKDQVRAAYTGVFGTAWSDRIEIFQFDGGRFLTHEDVMGRVIRAYSTSGHDHLFGFSRSDILDAGLGDDTVSGGNENDTYLFGRGDGRDVIEDNLDNILSGQDDTLRFKAGVRPEDIDIVREPGSSSITLKIRGTTDQVTLKNMFDAVATGVFGTFYFDRIETIQFDDGTTWSADQLRRRVLVEAGTSGNDVIDGYATEDVLDGKAGDDALQGGAMSDVYVFARGHGHDTIRDDSTNILLGNLDRVEFRGLARADVSVSRSGRDLIFTIVDTGETLTIIDQYVRYPIGGQWFAIEGFVFSDQTVRYTDLNPEDLDAVGTSASEEVRGSDYAETLDGLAGNDTLVGDGGGDTYRFGIGSGDDRIVDRNMDIRWNQADKVLFGPGILASDLIYQKVGDDLVITLGLPGNTDRLTLVDQFKNFDFLAIDELRFVEAPGAVVTAAEIEAILASPNARRGDDTIVGDLLTPNVLDGYQGNDELRGGVANDTYRFGIGYGVDTVVEASGFAASYDHVEFGEGIAPDTIVPVREGLDLVFTFPGATDSLRIREAFGARPVEEFRFADGAVWTLDHVKALLLAGTSGDDVITGFGGADDIAAGAGSDELRGEGGDDVYGFGRGDGADLIDDTAGVDTVSFGSQIAFEQLRLARDGDTLVMRIEGTADSLAIRSFFGSRPVESFVFEDGRTVTGQEMRDAVLRLQSTDGADRVEGDLLAADAISGGRGNDALVGRGGGDTYVFAAGDGRDIVDDQGGSGVDRVLFLDQRPAEAVVTRVSENGADLRIRFGGGDEVIVVGALDPLSPSFIERYEFMDGTIWTLTEIKQRLLRDEAGPGDDVVFGTPEAETIEGGTGDDALVGQGGGDTYVFNAGDGEDVVVDVGAVGQTDRIRIIGYGPEDTRVEWLAENAPDLKLTFGTSGDSIVLRNGASPGANLIEEVVFADGTIWSGSSLSSRIVATAATDDNDRIVGTAASETFEGGLGDDRLFGSGGADTFRFSRGDGSDVISDSSGSPDIVLIEGYLSSEARFASEPSDPTTLIITFAGTSDRIKVLGGLGPSSIETVSFLDDGASFSQAALRDAVTANLATTGADIVLGFAAHNDALRGGAGRDFLSGGTNGLTGGDVYTFQAGDGEDVIEDRGNATGADRINIVGYLPGDVTLGIDPSQPTTLVLRFAGGSDVLRISDTLGASAANTIEQIAFANGTVWTMPTVAALLASAPPVNTITGDADANTLVATTANDYLTGAAGSDTYRYAAGDGRDVIRDVGGGTADAIVVTGYSLAQTSFLREGNHLILRFSGSATDELRVTNALDGSVNDQIEQFDIGGSILTLAQVRALLLGATAGPEAADIIGFSGADTLAGGAGNDYLSGLGGADVYEFFAGDGRDLIFDNAGGTNTLRIHGHSAADALLSREDSTLVIRFAGSTDEIVLHQALDSGFNVFGAIVFDDGTSWTRDDLRARVITEAATSGGDTIFGFSSNDTLNGGVGEDELSGGAGGDTYLFQRGDGRDTVVDAGNVAGTDRILIEGYTPAETRLRRADPLGDDIIIDFDRTDDRITIIDALAGGIVNAIERIEFADGTIWLLADFAAMALAGQATDGGEFILGTGLADVLRSGEGDDVMSGGGGVDIYEFFAGDGDDTIDDQSGAGGQVRIHGHAAADTRVDRSPPDGRDLVLTFAGSADRLVVNKAFDSPFSGVATLRFDDGVVWTIADLRAGIVEAKATEGSDRIWGFANADVLGGGKGDDQLTGQSGADAYHFAKGDGRDVIMDKGSSTGADVLFIHGYDPGEVSTSRLYKDSDSLLLRFAGSGDEIAVMNTLAGSASNQIEEIRFDDGTVWTIAGVLAALDNRAPTANADAEIMAAKGGSLTIAAERLIGNDSDPDGDALSIVAVTGGPGGSFSLNAAGDIVFASDGVSLGSIAYTYTASDGAGGQSSVTNVLRVAPDPAPRNDDGLVVVEDGVLTITQQRLLANDIDGDLLRIESVGNAIAGAVDLLPGGDIRYTPDADATGAGGFTYTVTTPTGVSRSATVAIAITPVNDAPTVSESLTSVALQENTANAEPQLITDLARPVRVFDADGASFDGGEIRIRWEGGGLPSDNLLILAGGGVTIAGEQLLMDGEAVGSLSGGGAGADLVISLSGPGATTQAVESIMARLAFASPADAITAGGRALILTISDGAGGVSTGGEDAGRWIVDIAANDDGPAAVALSAAAVENEPLTAIVVSDDPDGPAQGVPSWRWQRDTGGGFADIAGAVSATYTPGDADVGPSGLGHALRAVATYVDGQGFPSEAFSAGATVADVNDAAVIDGLASGAVTEDAASGTASGQLTIEDVDSPASFQPVTAPTASTNGYGLFTLTAGGAWVYALDNANPLVDALSAGQTLDDSFTVLAADGTPAIVTVVITGADDNRPPVITSNGGGDAAAVAIPENGTVVTTVTAIDPDAGSLTYSIVGGADRALFDIDPVSGALTFKSAPDFETPGDADRDNVYELRVAASDGLASDAQDIAVSVTGINEAPTGIGFAGGAVPENSASGAFIGTLSTFDPDVGDSFGYSLARGLGDADNGLVRIIGDRIEVNGAIDFETNRTLELRLRSTDAAGLATERSIVVDVSDVFEPPAFNEIVGTAVADLRFGTAGNDRFDLRDGNDTAAGGAGNDVFLASSGDDLLYGDDFIQLRFGAVGSAAGADTIDGGGGDDQLFGGRGNDVLIGGSGRDTIAGQGGDDRLTGGFGTDVFVFEPRRSFFNFELTPTMGNDVIADFAASGPNRDRIDLSAFGIRFNGLTITESTLGGVTSTTITISGHTGSILLEGVQRSALSAADFLF